jgi:GxxExxY protein
MYEDEGYKLMGAAFEVYNNLGYGMAEEVYQECLEYELELRSIPFLTKHELSLVYKDRPLRKRYVPDLFVSNALVVELKSHAALIADHEAQLFNYMRIAHQPVGYLINFGNKEKLEWKRFILSDLRARTVRSEGNTNLR